MEIFKNLSGNKSEKVDTGADKRSGQAGIDPLSLLKEFGKIISHQENKAASNDGHSIVRGSLLRADSHGLPANFKRGSLLHAGEDTSHYKPGVLMGRLTHNENHAHQSDRNTGHNGEGQHMSVSMRLLLNKMHQDQMAAHHNPEQFQQNPQNWQRGTDIQEAQFAYRDTSMKAALAVARPLASLAPGADLNPNLGADPEHLRQMGLPMTRSIDRDLPGVMNVMHQVITRHPDQFHSQMANVGHGPFGNYGHDNYYRQANQALPYAGTRSYLRPSRS